MILCFLRWFVLPVSSVSGLVVLPRLHRFTLCVLCLRVWLAFAFFSWVWVWVCVCVCVQFARDGARPVPIVSCRVDLWFCVLPVLLLARFETRFGAFSVLTSFWRRNHGRMCPAFRACIGGDFKVRVEAKQVVFRNGEWAAGDLGMSGFGTDRDRSRMLYSFQFISGFHM